MQSLQVQNTTEVRMLVYSNGLAYCQYSEEPITTITSRGKMLRNVKKRYRKKKEMQYWSALTHESQKNCVKNLLGEIYLFYESGSWVFTSAMDPDVFCHPDSKGTDPDPDPSIIKQKF